MAPGSTVTISSWQRGRPDPCPDAELSLYGPGTDSGTFDYFTDEINGEEGAAARLQGLRGRQRDRPGRRRDQGGLGYFGFAYYEQNRTSSSRSRSTAAGAASRPARNHPGRQLFAALPAAVHLPSAEALQKPEVEAFVNYYVENVDEIAEARADSRGLNEGEAEGRPTRAV